MQSWYNHILISYNQGIFTSSHSVVPIFRCKLMSMGRKVVNVKLDILLFWVTLIFCYLGIFISSHSVIPMPWWQLGGKLWMWSWPAAATALAATCSHQAWTFMQCNPPMNGFKMQCNVMNRLKIQCNALKGLKMQCRLLTPTLNFYAMHANEWVNMQCQH